MFQYKTLNKRLIHVFIENLITNLFPLNTNQNLNSVPAATGNKSSQIQTYIRNYLTKSQRVKPEWKQPSQIFISKRMTTQVPTTSAGHNSIPRSKSIHSYVQC